MAGSILALPITAMMRRFRWSATLTGLILVECAALAFNGGRCPLTDLAARYTTERADNFDIYRVQAGAEPRVPFAEYLILQAKWPPGAY